MSDAQQIAKVPTKPHWELTPHPVRGCWRKKLAGKTYYVGKGQDGRYTEADYKAAWTEWTNMLAGIEAKQQADRFAARGVPFLSDLTTTGRRPTAAECEAAGLKLDDRTAALLDQPPGEVSANDLQFLLRETGNTTKESDDRTIAKSVERFLSFKKSQSKTGQKSVGRYANLDSYLKDFVDFMGSETDTMKINALTVPEYYARQLEQVHERKISDYYARDRIAAMKQFIRWAWTHDYCNMPKTLDSKDYVVAVTATQIEPMPIPALRTRVKAATGRLKLELLLMANCGFTQVDIGDLLHTEINWQAGTITRKRSKKQKGREENLPTVTWTLWPLTLQLLREHATKESPNVLATRQGEKTTSDRFSEAGKPVRSDATGQAYRKFEQKLIAKLNKEELPKLTEAQRKELLEAEILELVDGEVTYRSWPPKRIRKTSSTAIGNHPSYSRFAQYFLGHAPETTAGAHYVKPSEAEFRACCKWLGEELALV